MLSGSSTAQSELTGPAAYGNGTIWAAVDQLLAGADVAGVLANKLGPLAAEVWRSQGRVVPREFSDDEHVAKAAWRTSLPLLSHIRSICEGPLLLIKGPEVAALYPARARAFMDIDILSPHAEQVHAALRADGFIEVEDPDLFEHHHHLRPLQKLPLWLKVEVHLRPMWPAGSGAPLVQEIVDTAVPSATGVAGISAPDPAIHAVILASHAWVHEPLHTLRDLVDIAAVAARSDEQQLTAWSRRWGLERIWQTTYDAAMGLVGGRPPSTAVRVWARHLPAVSERTVLGNHLQRSLSSFWALPFPAALRATLRTLRYDLFPYAGETWREKGIRVAYALARPRSSLSSHTQSWQATARRGGDENGRSEEP